MLIFRSGLVAVDPAWKVVFLSGLDVGPSQMLPLVLQTEADTGYCFFVDHAVRHVTVPLSGNSLKAVVARYQDTGIARLRLSFTHGSRASFFHIIFMFLITKTSSVL